jgi:plastocyanin
VSSRPAPALAFAAAIGLLALAAGHAVAHGDTIRVSYAAVRPERLVIGAGTTVHFHNANSSGAPVTIVLGAGDAAVRSPVLGRAEGWHHTFDLAGEHPFHVAESPSRTGLVVVVTAPAD